MEIQHPELASAFGLWTVGRRGELFNTGKDTLRSARYCYFDLRDLEGEPELMTAIVYVIFSKVVDAKTGKPERPSGVNCPHPDFRLDNRLHGYEVLQQCPFEMYIGLGDLGSRIHVEGQEVILKTALLFTECTATLHKAGAGEGRAFPIQHLGAYGLIERYPHLSKLVHEQWGLMNIYIVFPALNAGDELKVVVTLSGGGRQIPFYVRKIEERER